MVIKHGSTPRRRWSLPALAGPAIATIVTNNHVVAGSTGFQVLLANGKEYAARVVGTFPPDGLAVLQVDAPGLKAAAFADSTKIAVGDLTLAIGNPLGLQSSVTDGIVSAVGRTISESSTTALPNVIQTSAAINPGNSGGALVNLSGQVIGIPTLTATDPGLGGAQAPGIGFAIPSNTGERTSSVSGNPNSSCVPQISELPVREQAIVTNERLVHTEVLELPGSSDDDAVVETVMFAEQDGRTTLTRHVQATDRATRDLILESGVEEGLRAGWNRAEELVIELAAQETPPSRRASPGVEAHPGPRPTWPSRSSRAASR